MREQQRLEREQKELAERYAGAGGKDTALPVHSKRDPNATSDMIKERKEDGNRKSAQEEAMEKFLQAQAEAEELKRNKFRSKRQHSDAGVAKQESVPAAAASAPVYAPRGASPPLPAQRRDSNMPKDGPMQAMYPSNPPQMQATYQPPSSSSMPSQMQMQNQPSVDAKTRAVLDQLADIKKARPTRAFSDDRNWNRKSFKFKAT